MEKFGKEQRKLFLERIENLVSDKEFANFGTKKGRVELEVVIRVSPDDKKIFTGPLLDQLKEEIRSMTGIISPVVYLEGEEPEWIKREILI